MWVEDLVIYPWFWDTLEIKLAGQWSLIGLISLSDGRILGTAFLKSLLMLSPFYGVLKQRIFLF